MVPMLSISICTDQKFVFNGTGSATESEAMTYSSVETPTFYFQWICVKRTMVVNWNNAICVYRCQIHKKGSLRFALLPLIAVD